MPRPRTDNGFPGLFYGKERQIVSVHVLLMIGTKVSHNPGIPASVGNPVSCVQAGVSDIISSVPFS